MATGPAATILDSIEEHSRAGGISHEHTYYLVHIKKGKGESEVEIDDPAYVVTVDRSKGTRLGLKLDVQVSTRSLFIKEVVGGLAFTWNTAHQDSKVRPGDRIVRVNKTEGDALALMEECKKCQPMEIEMLRGTAVPITGGLRVTAKRAFGAFQDGQVGSVAKVDDEGDALMKMIGPSGAWHQWVHKQDYDKFIFEDSERFYLKRYCDFKDLYACLKAKIEEGKAKQVLELPEIPAEERFGFRRQLSSLGMSSFMQNRREGLQKFVDAVLSQVDKLDAEPALAEFFGSQPLPDVGASTKEMLKQRLDGLITKHKVLEQTKAAAA